MNRVLFMGRKQVAAEALSYLVGLKSVEIVGVITDSHLNISPTSEVAKKAALPLLDYATALNKMKDGELSFDLGLSVLYWRRLREEFLTIPRKGVINFHPAPLPDFKGTAGYNVAILDELDYWAVSAHYVDEDIDTGDIIEVSKFRIESQLETALSLEKKSMSILLDLFRTVARKALDSDKLLNAVPNVGGRYISRDEMERMKELHPGDDISKKIRAFWFPPYDGAFIIINGSKYTLIDRFILEQLADSSYSNPFKSESG